MEYRRLRDKDAWHWCRNCKLWPKVGYVSVKVKPTTGELCNQCKAKEQAQECEKD